MGRAGRELDGELPSGTDLRQLGELLAGPLYLRLLFAGGAIDDTFIDETVARVLRVFRAPETLGP